MACVCNLGALPPFPRDLVKARSHAILPESGPAKARELLATLHQKDIDWGKRNRNHRRKPIVHRINYDEVFVTDRLCRGECETEMIESRVAIATRSNIARHA